MLEHKGIRAIERRLIAHCILNSAELDGLVLDDRDFSEEFTAELFRALQAAKVAGLGGDATAIAEAMFFDRIGDQDSEQLQAKCAREILEVLEYAQPAVSVSELAGSIKRAAALRRERR